MGWGVTGNRFRVLGAIPRYSYRCLPTIYHNSDHLVIYSFSHSMDGNVLKLISIMVIQL